MNIFEKNKENNHEQIIDKKTFYQIQTLLQEHKYKQNKFHQDELINLMYCKECGYKIGLNKPSEKVDEKTRVKLEALIEKSYLSYWRKKRLFDIFFARNAFFISK